MTKDQLIEKLVKELIENYDTDTQISRYKGLTLRVSQDEHPTNPREYYAGENRLFCFHKRHNIGDKQNYNQKDFSSWSEFEGQLKKDYDIHSILPVYMYEHGGVRLDTTSSSSRWDSEQVGYIFITNDYAKRLGEVKNSLKYYVKDYSRYLNGEIQEISLYYCNKVIGKKDEITQNIDAEVIKEILISGCVFDDWDDEKFEKLINLDSQIQSLLDN